MTAETTISLRRWFETSPGRTTTRRLADPGSSTSDEETVTKESPRRSSERKRAREVGELYDFEIVNRGRFE